MISADGDDSSRYEDVSDTEDNGEDPFKTIPALRGFHLSGARVALGRTPSYREPSEQSRQFWFQARGFGSTEGWKSVKASKLTAVYTGHEKSAPFAAQTRH